ncbi:MAG: ABC transporter ATP-binding protein [Patescibacteria group bacterium]
MKRKVVIDAENLIRTYKSGDAEVKVLRGLSLQVQEGEFVSIIGRSGSGKSTLLYQLSLLDVPTSGRVFVDGVDTSTFSEEERTRVRLNEMGYIFQDYALVPELTAEENVVIPLLMQDIETREARRRARVVLEKVGLLHRLKNLPNQLSGGEQQRVAIARALGHSPKIIFADEPTANLDNETSLVILELFKQLHKEGQTIIMVTHEREYTAETDRVIKIFDGSIVFEGSPKELRE